ncbi:MAG: hypothetical protein IJ784_04965 [Ruminiclostridium sp.]|nr:hypothetical protein [Ruminiclostridium sp.]
MRRSEICAVCAIITAVMICASSCSGSDKPQETSDTKKTAVTASAQAPKNIITGFIDLSDDDDTAPVTEAETEDASEPAEESASGITDDSPALPETAAPETETVTETTTAVTEETTVQTSAETTAQTTAETTAGTTAETTAAASSGSYDPSFFANDYFIGDSIYTGLTGYGYFPDSQVFAKVGLNPQSARTSELKGMTAVSKAQGLQPARIYIMLGSNGLAYMGNANMANNMKLLVEDLKAVCPDSTVCVVSIPPVTKAHNDAGQETMDMVNDYNSRLKTMSSEAGVTYLDLCSQLLNEDGYFSKTYAEADGLHFLGAAYKRMLSFFQSSVS